MNVEAQEIGRTFDCVFPGCPLESRWEGGYCPDGHRGARPETARQVGRLREQGTKQEQIAKMLGISRSYVAELVSDPDGLQARARKELYRMPCPNGCGNMMSGCNGFTGAPQRCRECAFAAQHDNRFWTRDQIVAVFQHFRHLTGRTPAVADKTGRLPSMSKKLSPERLIEVESFRDMLPHPGVVAREFGSWDEALKAAGMKPNPSGGPSHRRKTHREKDMKQFVVLKKDGANSWVEVETVDAMDGDSAIGKAADEIAGYVAVPVQHFIERQVEPRNVFAVTS